MKKTRKICVTFILLTCISQSGCGDMTILDEIPQNASFSVVEEETRERIEKVPTQWMTGNPQEDKALELATPWEASKFTYNRLSKNEQLWYLDIEQLIGNMEEKGRLSDVGIQGGLDETAIDKIFQCVLNDHPEFFYIDGYAYTKYTSGDELLYIEFAGNYNLDKETVLTRKSEIEDAASKILEGISQDASDYEKVKYVYETIILNTDYVLNSPDNQNIYSVFVRKSSVCQGYAKATQYLLNRLGVECTIVQGSVDNGEGHAWNLVQVEGNYYYVDTTWGDAYYQVEEEYIREQNYPEINYEYLCITTKELLKTHIIQAMVPMPECVAVEYNYYVNEGAYFTSYDREQMGMLFAKALEQNKKDVTIKCSSEDCFQDIMKAMIQEYEIFDYLEIANNQISYSHNDKRLSMTFWVTNE